MVFIKRNAQPMPTKSLELPLKVAQAFTRDMRAFFKAKTQLGSVEIQDSQIGMAVIQAPKGVWNAPIRFDGRSMG
jgi:hypothetical protein